MTGSDKRSTDFDHILRDIREKLHDKRGRKAAAMVGAGFSRNAKPKAGSTRGFPLWSDLMRGLISELYIDPQEQERENRTAGAISSAVRYAQEYEVEFGRPALVELVRRETCDDEFSPGPLLESLVDLPWADIFTTNYDLLLERATLSRSGKTLRKQSYDVITRADQLPLARRPRIIKLHGTLPNLDDLVVTEEDFRTYRTKHASFVNAVRASLSENAFCLFGFSGDDPNFLAWSGWVRDTLQSSAPPIYLFCGDSQKRFQTKLLEERKIVPIPLKAISGKKDYDESFRWLLEFLSEDPSMATVSWNRMPDVVGKNDKIGTKEPWHKEGSAFDTALLWRKHRKQYAGWHVLHREGLNRLWSSTQFWLRETSFASDRAVPIWKRVLFIRELAWRISVCLHPLFDSDVFGAVDPLLKEVAELSESERTEAISQNADFLVDIAAIECELLRHAREVGDADRFQHFVKLIRDNPLFDEEHNQFVVHQEALMLLGQLKVTSARHHVSEWKTGQANPIWSVRRAGLLLELGCVDEATRVLTSLSNELTLRRSQSAIDIEKRSLEGLALFLLWCCQRHGEANSRTNQDHSISDALEEESETHELIDASDLHSRLRELRPIGCDPQEFLNWLQTSLIDVCARNLS